MAPPLGYPVSYSAADSPEKGPERRDVPKWQTDRPPPPDGKNGGFWPDQPNVLTALGSR